MGTAKVEWYLCVHKQRCSSYIIYTAVTNNYGVIARCVWYWWCHCNRYLGSHTQHIVVPTGWLLLCVEDNKICDNCDLHTVTCKLGLHMQRWVETVKEKQQHKRGKIWLDSGNVHLCESLCNFDTISHVQWVYQSCKLNFPHIVTDKYYQNTQIDINNTPIANNQSCARDHIKMLSLWYTWYKHTIFIYMQQFTIY